MFGKKVYNINRNKFGRVSIFDTEYKLNKRNFREVLSASLGGQLVIQERFEHLFTADKDWSIDFSKEQITFGTKKFPIKFIGSESTVNYTWMWGYNNINNFAPSVIDLAQSVLSQGNSWSLPEVTTSQLQLSELVNGHNLATVACNMTSDEFCYYRAVHEGGSAFVAVDNVPAEVYAPVDGNNFVRIVLEAIKVYDVDHKIFVESFLFWNFTNYSYNGNSIIANFPFPMSISFENVNGVWRINSIDAHRYTQY